MSWHEKYDINDILTTFFKLATAAMSFSTFASLKAWKIGRLRARDPALDLVHQHLAVDHAQAVFFGEVLDLDDGWHGESGKAEILKSGNLVTSGG